MDYLAGNVQLVIAIFEQYYGNNNSTKNALQKEGIYYIRIILLLSLCFVSSE